MSKAIGFIGLGVMGSPMAGHLANLNNNISVFNRTVEKSKTWNTKYKGVICGSPAELARISEDIFYIDAPVSGGEAGAQSGQLSIMAGGDKKSFNLIENIIKPYTKFIKYMGPPGSGQLTKMVNQICIAGLIQALAEGINFSKKVGLNSQDVLEVVSKGAAQSWQMENRWETMTQNKYDHGFAVDLMRKDLDILLRKADKSNINLDVTKIINEFYKDIQDIKGGRWDTSSLLKRIEELT